MLIFKIFIMRKIHIVLETIKFTCKLIQKCQKQAHVIAPLN